MASFVTPASQGLLPSRGNDGFVHLPSIFLPAPLPFPHSFRSQNSLASGTSHSLRSTSHTLRPLASSSSSAALSSANSKPSPAESARTLMEVCTEGTLSTITQDGWPMATAVRFAVDLHGNPIISLTPSAACIHHLQAQNRATLHVQMQQPGHKKPHCTLKGILLQTKLEQKLGVLWDRRLADLNINQQLCYVINVDEVLYIPNMEEEGAWVSDNEYRLASPDPLRECATSIVEDMNKKHWEDIRRFGNVYGKLDILIEEACMSWVDRLGFDLQVRTSSQELKDIRIPFSREVTDERDARSTLTIMAQIAWEYERNYITEIQTVGI